MPGFCFSKNITERFFLEVLDKNLGSLAQSVLETADHLVMTMRTTEKDLNLKSQLIVSASGSGNSDDICNEKVWPTDGLIKYERSDFGMEKVKHPDKTLFFIRPKHT